MRKEMIYTLAGLTLAFFIIYINKLFFESAETLRKAKDYVPLEVGVRNEYSRVIKTLIHDFYSLSYILIISFIIAFSIYLISKKRLK